MSLFLFITVSAAICSLSLDGEVGMWTPAHSIALRALCGAVNLLTHTVNVRCDCAPLPRKCVSFSVKTPLSEVLCCGLSVLSHTGRVGSCS